MTGDAPITELDLHAYVDGRLDAERCGAVEEHLALHPEAAAHVMADMASARTLRALLDAPLPPAGRGILRPARALAAGLSGGLSAGRKYRRLGVAASLAGVFLGGWVAGQVAPARPMTPEFVDEAVMSRRTSLVRARMDSQPEVLRLDRAEISAATRVVLPTLPSDWRVTDVQVFPSDEGPSVGMAFQSRELGPVSLFAVRTKEVSQIAPTTIRRDEGLVAYWRHGDMAYALMASAERSEVAKVARRLAASTAGAPDRS